MWIPTTRVMKMMMNLILKINKRAANKKKVMMLEFNIPIAMIIILNRKHHQSK